MRLALVTTPPSVASGIGDYTRALLETLQKRVEVTVFVAPGSEGEVLAGLPTRSAAELWPRDHDQILYQVGNERHHAFMVPLLRAFGGAATLHDWILFDLAVAAWPALVRGGAAGHWAVLREGGVRQAATYFAYWRARRRARLEPFELPDAARQPNTLDPSVAFVAGWYPPEREGRWCSDRALLYLPGARSVHLDVRAAPGRRLCVGAPHAPAAQATFDAQRSELGLDVDVDASGVLELEVHGVGVPRSQRRVGDSRRLGVFLRGLRVQDGAGTRAVDLCGASSLPIAPNDLSTARFDLPLNRAVVRFADAFVVHSAHMAERVRVERNGPTPIGLVHHGARPSLRGDDRRVERARLGLPAAWREAFLVTSFGALQAHKRLHVLLEAVACARASRPDVRLALLGPEVPQDFDARAQVRRLGLQDAVWITGRLDESDVPRWLFAGDLGVQLRGPSSGGTSGGLFQTLAAGRGVIASALDEQRELPDECVYKLHPGAGEAERLAHKLVDLRDSPSVRAAMEAAARAFVENECNWECVAERYVEVLERFPAPRAARRSLLSTRLARAGSAGYARGRAEDSVRMPK